MLPPGTGAALFAQPDAAHARDLLLGADFRSCSMFQFKTRSGLSASKDPACAGDVGTGRTPARRRASLPLKSSGRRCQSTGCLDYR